MSRARDEHRKQVELLVGKSNTLPKDATKSGPIDPSVLDNPRVCKSFLCGKCPYDMLDNTKENIGKCPRMHIEKFKLVYESLVEEKQMKYLHEYMIDLRNFVAECDRRVAVAEERLDYSESDKMLLEDLARKVEELGLVIELTTTEYDYVKDITKRIEISQKLRNMVFEMDNISHIYSKTLEKLNTVGEQKLQVCKTCGAYMLKNDTDGRLIDHYMGKIHMAYEEMRVSLEELKNKLSL